MSYIRRNSKLIRKVNVGNKTLPVLEENMGELLYIFRKILKIVTKKFQIINKELIN